MAMLILLVACKTSTTTPPSAPPAVVETGGQTTTAETGDLRDPHVIALEQCLAEGLFVGQGPDPDSATCVDLSFGFGADGRGVRVFDARDCDGCRVVSEFVWSVTDAETVELWCDGCVDATECFWAGPGTQPGRYSERRSQPVTCSAESLLIEGASLPRL